MAHRILIELSADDPVAMTSKGVLDALRRLWGCGVRVSGIEALSVELFVVASFLRLELEAGPLAGGLDLPGEDGAPTREERLEVVRDLEGLRRDSSD